MAYALAIDNSGNVLVSGWSWNTTTDSDIATIKYDSSGAEQWVSRYNCPGDGYCGAIALTVDNSGSVYVTGRMEHSDTDIDYATIKYNASGHEQWVALYDGPGNGPDYPSAIAVDVLGNVYVTGWSWNWGSEFDYATVKYDSLGQERWVMRYDGPDNGSDEAKSLAVDISGNVYVTGHSDDLTLDYLTIKYQQGITDVEMEELGGSSRYSQSHNYTNPFNPSTAIDYALPRRSYVKLVVFNVLGEQISVLSEGLQDPGYHSVVFEAEELPSGIYFYRLQAGGFVETRKLVLLR
jgi:hypothetical protein